MGVGPFNIERPFTAGDSGWFGVERPLVGAANAIKAEVTTQSAGQVAVDNGTPDRVRNLRDQINDLKREIDNRQEKLERINELGQTGFMREEGISARIADRRRNNLIDEIEMMEDEKERLLTDYNELVRETEEGNLLPREIKQGIEDPVRNALVDIGVSKGPFIQVSSGTTTIMFTATGITQSDISDTRRSLEQIGFQVGNVEAFEV
jgi:hypothetical protein